MPGKFYSKLVEIDPAYFVVPPAILAAEAAKVEAQTRAEAAEEGGWWGSLTASVKDLGSNIFSTLMSGVDAINVSLSKQSNSLLYFYLL